MTNVIVSGAFDDIRSRDIRFLHEASTLGPVHVFLWSDEDILRIDRRAPRFPEAERRYFLEAIRYVDKVTLSTGIAEPDNLPEDLEPRPRTWAIDSRFATPMKQNFCNVEGLTCRVLGDAELQGYPALPDPGEPGDKKRRKVIATGCYDWFHSGHVRFFEEVSALGDLYLVVGNDANLRLLKGEGHPLFPEDERRYMVQSIRYVHRALIATGSGWMDAAPEIEIIRPDIYAVNEDGDKPEKRKFCKKHGLEYVVLKRTPAEGLPRRESTHLRGF